MIKKGQQQIILTRAAGFGPVLLMPLGMVDFLSMVVLSMLTVLLSFSAVVSFLSRFYTSAITLGVVASIILALETITLISSTNWSVG